MSKYLSLKKTDISNLPENVIQEMIEGLEELENKIQKTLETKILSPKILYNLKKVLEKDIKIVKEIITL